MQLTPLEKASLARFHALYGANAFPPPECIHVVNRTQTPCGRFVELRSDGVLSEADGHLDLRGEYIEVTGLQNGLMAVVEVESGKLVRLEFASYGGESWNGEELGFSFTDG